MEVQEYDYINRAGSFLYEPPGSVHTLQSIEDDTHVWFQMYGANLILDANGNIESAVDGALTLAAYLMLCEAEGLPRPNVLAGWLMTTTAAGEVDLASPDTFIDGVPHDALTALRRTDQVHWQPIVGEPGFWAVLRHGDVAHVARHPENLAMMRSMLLAMDPPVHTTHRAALAPFFRARVMAGIEDRVREICRGIMAEARERHEVEFVHGPSSATTTRCTTSGGPRCRTTSSRVPASPPPIRWRCTTRRPTGTKKSSTSHSCSTSTGTRIHTCPSASPDTSASVCT